MFTRALLILNPAAAGGRSREELVRRLEEALPARGIRLEIARTTAPGHARELASRVGGTAGDFDLVISGGGDGTIGEIADGLLRSAFPRTPVLVAPFGTGNDVARLVGTAGEAGVIRALDARCCVDWDTLEIVAGQGRGRAVLFGACGLSTDLLRLTTPRVKRWFGARLAYPVGFFRALLRYRPARLTVETPEGRHEGEFVAVVAANAPHAGGDTMRIAPGARLDDGRLDLSLIRAVGRWEIARQFIRLVRGRHIHHPRVTYFRTTEVRIEAVPAGQLAVDGELGFSTPVTIRVAPRSLRLLAAPAGVRNTSGVSPAAEAAVAGVAPAGQRSTGRR